MKIWLCATLSLLCLLTTGCAVVTDTGESSAPTTTTTTVQTTTTAQTKTTTAPTFLTEEQAVAIAEQYWGIRNGDVAPETGFTMTISPMVLPTADTPEYVIALRWLVEDENGQVSHSSTLDRVTINAYTGDIVDPATIQPE